MTPDGKAPKLSVRLSRCNDPFCGTCCHPRIVEAAERAIRLCALRKGMVRDAHRQWGYASLVTGRR